jgi:undecaprenyl pyrophosphate phosphatase UppP
MSKTDKIKERINYLKVWLGIFVVTNIGLMGWLAEHYDESKIKSISAFCAVIIIGVLVLIIHKKINHKIDELEEL